MAESQKRVDESWKEQVEREKQQGPPPQQTPPPLSSPQEAPAAPQPSTSQDSEVPQARFDLFVSSLAMEALIALGDIPHPVTRKQSMNLTQARYLIDTLGVLEEKTQGNLTVDEERLMKDTVYQLRMRYLAKSGQ